LQQKTQNVDQQNRQIEATTKIALIKKQIKNELALTKAQIWQKEKLAQYEKQLPKYQNLNKSKDDDFVR